MLAALAAPILAWAAPAAASVEPPPASEETAQDAAAPDAPAAQETPDASADAASAREKPEAPATEPSAERAAPPAPAAPAAADAPIPPAATTKASPDIAAPSARPATASPAGVVAIRDESSASSPRIGAGVDLGLPDGATISIVARPIRAIRAHAGLSHNMISLGERVGITWIPLSWWVSPTLSVEYGHYADGNANPLARMVTGDHTLSSPVLDRVGYDYANAHAGIELGRRWFTFYVHAGYSRVTGTVHNLSAETMSQSSGTTSITFAKDPSVRLWSISARVGFIVYLAK